MTLNEFAFQCHQTAEYPPAKALDYLSRGMAGEVGELCGKLAKVDRGDTPLGEMMPAALKEAGDVLWFLAEFATMFHPHGLQGLADDVVKKLADRKERGVIKGSGDNR